MRPAEQSRSAGQAWHYVERASTRSLPHKQTAACALTAALSTAKVLAILRARASGRRIRARVVPSSGKRPDMPMTSRPTAVSKALQIAPPARLDSELRPGRRFSPPLASASAQEPARRLAGLPTRLPAANALIGPARLRGALFPAPGGAALLAERRLASSEPPCRLPRRARRSSWRCALRLPRPRC